MLSDLKPVFCGQYFGTKFKFPGKKKISPVRVYPFCHKLKIQISIPLRIEMLIWVKWVLKAMTDVRCDGLKFPFNGKARGY